MHMHYSTHLRRRAYLALGEGIRGSSLLAPAPTATTSSSTTYTHISVAVGPLLREWLRLSSSFLYLYIIIFLVAAK